jgi:hypothetical protein
MSKPQSPEQVILDIEKLTHQVTVGPRYMDRMELSNLLAASQSAQLRGVTENNQNLVDASVSGYNGATHAFLDFVVQLHSDPSFTRAIYGSNSIGLSRLTTMLLYCATHVEDHSSLETLEKAAERDYRTRPTDNMAIELRPTG